MERLLYTLSVKGSFITIITRRLSKQPVLFSLVICFAISDLYHCGGELSFTLTQIPVIKDYMLVCTRCVEKTNFHGIE